MQTTTHTAGNTTAVKAVMNYVEQAIHTGQFVDGKLPTEADVAAIVGVSRTPVREAMKILEAVGVIEIRRGIGTFMKPHARSALGYLLMFETATQTATAEQLYEARLMVEHTAAELASARSKPDDIDRMRKANDKLRRLAEQPNTDLDAVTEADIDFHRKVFEASGNPLIVAIGKLTIEQVRPWVRMTNENEGPMKSVEIHEAMISAIEKHDLAEARRSTSFAAVRDGLEDWRARLLKV